MLKRSAQPSLFPPRSYDDDDANHCEQRADFNQFKIAKPSFLTVGHMIRLIYMESAEGTFDLTTNISLSDICDISEYERDCNATNEAASTPKSLETIATRPLTIPSPIQNIFREELPQCFR